MVRELLPRNGRVLDLGCGRGGLVEQLDIPLDQIVGLDPDWLSLVEHRLDLPRTAGFSHALPFATESFDLIFCSWLLEHLGTPQIDFAEIARVLRPDGVLVFITPNGWHPLALVNGGLGRFARLQGVLVRWVYGREEEDTFPTCYLANTERQIGRLAELNLLQIDQLHFVEDPSYLAFNQLLFRVMCWLNSRVLPHRMRVHLVGVLRK